MNVSYYIIFIIIILGGRIHESSAQSRCDTSYIETAKNYPENILVFTDRTLYAVNETIRFSAILQSGEMPYQGLGTKVMYAELINSEGKEVVNDKYLIYENHTSGDITIPSTAHTGLYYLRFYTRWMRNFGAQNYTYIPINVVNPHTTNLTEIDLSPENRTLKPYLKTDKSVSCTIEKKVYTPGEIVDLEISLNDPNFNTIQYGSITVVPSGTIDTTSIQYKVFSGETNEKAFRFDFLPEITGTSIAGSVIPDNKMNSVKDIRVHFSILGDNPAYFVTTSDENGRFLINMPSHKGNLEMYVVGEFPDGASGEIRIDHDFAIDPLPFHPEAFQLDKNEHKLASRISLNTQLKKAFLADSKTDSAASIKQDELGSFYGNPHFSLKIDEFINLPNMEEVIVNLLPGVLVMKQKDSVYFKIISDNPFISWYPPLLLIDHIPVFDMEAILAISPTKIDQIDVVKEIYVKGSQKYGGVISFKSLGGDMAGVDLPVGSYFFDYKALHPSYIKQTSKSADHGRIPDLRNTLLWMDNIELQKNKPFKTNFITAPIPGKYQILFRGVAENGEVAWGLREFVVE